MLSNLINTFSPIVIVNKKQKWKKTGYSLTLKIAFAFIQLDVAFLVYESNKFL